MAKAVSPWSMSRLIWRSTWPSSILTAVLLDSAVQLQRLDDARADPPDRSGLIVAGGFVQPVEHLEHLAEADLGIALAQVTQQADLVAMRAGSWPAGRGAAVSSR